MFLWHNLSWFLILLYGFVLFCWSLHSGTTGSPGSTLILISCLNPIISHFSKKSWFLLFYKISVLAMPIAAGVLFRTLSDHRARKHTCVYTTLCITYLWTLPHAAVSVCIKLKLELTLMPPTLIHEHKGHSNSLHLLICKLPSQKWEICLLPPDIHLLNCSIHVYMYISIRIVNPYPYGK